MMLKILREKIFCRNKKAQVISEVTKMVLAVIFLILLVGVIILLVSGRGGQILDTIKNLLRFGRP